jgi:hypothetical protein
LLIYRQLCSFGTNTQRTLLIFSIH